jgi:hypothetical protein
LGQHQDLHVTLTVLIGVALGCGALYWSGKSAAPAPPTPTNSAVMVEPPAVHTTESASLPIVHPPVQTETVPVRPGPNTALPETPNYDAPELPIVFAFSERTLYTTEENDAGSLVNVSKRIKEGVITNSSDKPLSVTAIEVNLPTQETSQIQLLLGAGAQKHFGPEQGLKMISGDQLTLRSASYRESVQQIP